MLSEEMWFLFREYLYYECVKKFFYLFEYFEGVFVDESLLMWSDFEFVVVFDEFCAYDFE